MSPRPKMITPQGNLLQAVKEIAWKQIAETGAAALSLRAIARELNISAPSIYNYYPNRDALVTALIVDAYDSLANTQEASIENIPMDKLPERLFALGVAYRQWAVATPQRYQLIFGTPLPNYHAPEEITTPAAARGLVPLTRAIQDLYSAGKIRTERFASMTPRLEAMLREWQHFADNTDLEVLYLALIIWSRVHGLVGLEIGSQFPSFLDDPAEVFNREMKNILIQYI